MKPQMPSKIEDFAGKALVWWLGEIPVANCGTAEISLSQSASGWRVTARGSGPLPDEFWGCSGTEFTERPTDEQFQESTRSMLEALYREGRL